MFRSLGTNSSDYVRLLWSCATRTCIATLIPVAITAALLTIAPLAGAQSSSTSRDSFARIIDRADAVVLGRVLEAGTHWIPDGVGGVTPQAFVRVAVEHWIVGPDADTTVEVRLDAHDEFLAELETSALQSNRRVVLYLARAYQTWWLVREVVGSPSLPSVGVEFLTTEAATNRIAPIQREFEGASPDSLAALADLVVVGSLSRHTAGAQGLACRIERVIAGACAESILTVVSSAPADLHRGRAILMLKPDTGGAWRVLRDGAGCYYLNRDRIARSTDTFETVVTRMASAHARHVGGDGR